MRRLAGRVFTGGSVEVACGPDGRIVATGPGARDALGPGAEVVELDGEVLPGLQDAHIHLGWLAQRRLGVELVDAASKQAMLRSVGAAAAKLPAGRWLIGRGWYNDAWPDPAFPTRHDLDAVTGARPAILTRKDGHSALLNTAALRAAGFTAATEDPEGGVIDRERGGREPAGMVREEALWLARRAVPQPSEAELDRGMRGALDDLARFGLTSVSGMDQPRDFASLQRLDQAGRLPIRVTYNLPAAELAHAERMGMVSGWGGERLRIWGVKAFLDGSLGSRTAEMLDGTGVATFPQDELRELARRCAAAGLSVAWHAIGDKAVRRALDALEPLAGAHRLWRPRIEHAQCVDPADMPRFKRAGVIASMQPIHAVADRELADREWPGRTAHAYAWAALARAGARLAFGSDAPVETADPLPGIDAATDWRKRSGWHPELAISRAAAIRAYTAGAAYAVGMERQTGSLKAGLLCDLTVVRDGRVSATVVGGELAFRS